MIGPEPDQPFDEAYIGIKGAVEAAPWPLFKKYQKSRPVGIKSFVRANR